MAAVGIGVLLGAGLIATSPDVQPAGADTSCQPYKLFGFTIGQVCPVRGSAPLTVTINLSITSGCVPGRTPNASRMVWADGTYDTNVDVTEGADGDPNAGSYCLSTPASIHTHLYNSPGYYVGSFDNLYADTGWQQVSTQTFTVAVKGPNTTPVAANDSRIVAANATTELAVTLNDSDADHDPLTVSVPTNTTDAGGSVVCGDTTCDYTPPAGFSGADAFQYTASDGFGGSDTATVSLDVVDASGALSGTVRDPGGIGVPGATVVACRSGVSSCPSAHTDNNGAYSMSGLITGAYAISARPTTTDLVASPDSTIPIASGANVHDFALARPVAPPPEATITARTTTPEGIPVVPVFFSVLTTEGCANGTATYEIHDQAGALINGSGLPETPVGSGHYENIIGSLPRGRLISIAISVVCPVPDDNSTVDFDAQVFIDPSGTVVTTSGAPVTGATVTLLRSDDELGPFIPVPDGSTFMSPANRQNPVVTGSDGTFAWDVVPGFYKVTASKLGCHSPDDPLTPAAASSVLPIPPAVTGLNLVLECSGLSISDATMVEGDTGKRAMRFFVRLPEASRTPVRVSYQVEADNATAGTDYIDPKIKTLSFTTNRRTGLTPVVKPITINIKGNTVADGDRTFRVVLTNPTVGHPLVDDSGLGTIVDDDPNAGSRVDVGDVTVTEGDAGNAGLAVPLSRTDATGNATVTISVHGIGGAGSADFKAGSKPIKFAAGQFVKYVAVTLYGDKIPESGEAVQLDITSASGAEAGRSGTLTILDDD